jgi:hypothetical protein
VCSNESKSSKNHKTHIAIAALADWGLGTLSYVLVLLLTEKAMQQNNSVEPESPS